MYHTIEKCLVCDQHSLELALALGQMPVVNRFPYAHEAAAPTFPLELMRCSSCGHCQISVQVDPHYLFSDYSYVSGTTEILSEHARTLVRMYQTLGVQRSASLLEIGSNDGTLLEKLHTHFSKVLGVDPAQNIVAEAQKKGIPTICTFFDLESATKIVQEHGVFDVVLARHVFAHVGNPLNVLQGMAQCLHPEGVIAIEFPHLLAMFENVAFDMIYHEHICFFSAHALATLARRVGLKITHIEEVNIHGGSLVVCLQHEKASTRMSPAAADFLHKEEISGLLTRQAVDQFVKQTQETLDHARHFFAACRKETKQVWGYGASAKAQILLNSIQCGTESVEKILDRSPYKAGRLSPGMRIPVVHPEQCSYHPSPDVLVIFAWNLAPEIVRQMSTKLPATVQFVTLIPKVEYLQHE